MQRTPIRKISAARGLVAFVTLLSGLSCLPLGAETVLHRFTSASPDPRFERLLYLAAGTELLGMGVSSRADEEAEAAYVLTAEYALSEGTATLEYSLSARESPQKPKETMKASLKVDSRFDAKAAELVRKLVKRAGIAFVPDPEAYIDGILALPAPVQEAQTETLAPEPSIAVELPPEAPAGDIPLEEIAETENAEPSETAVPIEDASPSLDSEKPSWIKPGLELSASVIGLAFLGELSRFIHYGTGGEAYAGARWPFGPWSVSAGLEGGWARAFNDPDVSSGPLAISNARLGARLGWTGSGARAFLSASAGATILTLFSPQGQRSKTVPFANTEIAALLPIARNLSLGLGLGFQAIFDATFIPAIASSIILEWEM